jgi:hypothetical protein
MNSQPLREAIEDHFYAIEEAVPDVNWRRLLDHTEPLDIERLARAIHSTKIDAAPELDDVCREAAKRLAAAYQDNGDW